MKRQRTDQHEGDGGGGGSSSESSNKGATHSRSRSRSSDHHWQSRRSSSGQVRQNSETATAPRSSPATSSTPQSQTGNKVSCLQCRSSKVKCLPTASATTSKQSFGEPSKCARCLRLSTECVYEKHKRGRRPQSANYSRIESQLHGLLSELRSDAQGSDSLSRDVGERHRQRLRGLTSDLLSEWRQGGNDRATPPVPSYRVPNAVTRKTNSASVAQRLVTPPLGGEDNLSDSGLPSLSNPLKLLVQASEDHAGEIEGRGEDREGEGEGNGQHIGRRMTNTSEDPSKTQAERTPIHHHRPSYHGSSAAPRGLYDADHDIGPHLDPITIGLLTATQAEHLWSVFLVRLSHPLIILDPKLYVFDYIRPRSAMLLSVGVSLAARFVTPTPTLPTPSIAESIEKHVLGRIIPTILLDGKRSVHIIKAFALLAAYSASWVPLGEDRSFSYVSWAWSMCVELDLNRRMVSLQADPNDEMLQRKLRERERTYLLCWTYSFSIALHTGRRCSLSIHDPMIAAAKEWHHSPYALPEDAGLVSNVQLRQLIARNLDYYTSHVAPLMPKGTELAGRSSSSSDSQPDPACRLLLEFHGRSIREDLDAWHATWVMPTSLGHRQHADRADGAATDHANSAHSSKPFRLRTTAFYHSYASLILHSLPLQYGSHNSADDQDVSLRRFAEQAQRAALSVMAFFLRLDLELITTAHNSIFLTAGFAAVYALLRGSQTGEEDGPPPQYVPTGEIETIERMIEQVVDRMEEAGRVTEHRSSFASQQAEFLRRIVRLQSLKRRSRSVGVVTQMKAMRRDDVLISPFERAAKVNSNGWSRSEHAYQPELPAPSLRGDACGSSSDLPTSSQSHSDHPSTAALSHQDLSVPRHSGQYLDTSAIHPPTQTSHISGRTGGDRTGFQPSLNFDLNLDLNMQRAGMAALGGGSSSNSNSNSNNGSGNGSGDFVPSGISSSWILNASDLSASARGSGIDALATAQGRTAGSADALMDSLMMNNPIGLHLNSLLAPDPTWGPSDWSFFPPDVDLNRT